MRNYEDVDTRPDVSVRLAHIVGAMAAGSLQTATNARAQFLFTTVLPQRKTVAALLDSKN
jgi:hypothetical protein